VRPRSKCIHGNVVYEARRSRTVAYPSGTGGSNPAPSSGESSELRCPDAIDVALLAELTADDLKDLGVNLIGRQRRR
jgi:hypothetical protein